MAKRSNNSVSRRSYGAKPYDANNSFVKKMATKVSDLIPQRSWISKWFNASQDNDNESKEPGLVVEGEPEEEAEIHQPPTKRPRIRMDVTHPPGTFSIRARDENSSNINDSTREQCFSREMESEEYFLEPAVAGPSGVCKFVSSTPVVVSTDTKNSNSQRSQRSIGSLMLIRNNGTSNGIDDNSESGESTSGCSSLIPQTSRQEGDGNSAFGSNLAGSRTRFINDKLSSANHPQSPRYLFLENGTGRESLSSRRPSFSASMMNNNNNKSSSSNVGCNKFERTSSLSSPFYSGNVTFGGSNALGTYKRSRSLFNSSNEFQLKVPRRTSVQVKPSNTESGIDASGMSQTAKRILEAMEYFSSPVTDAKRIPMKTSSESMQRTTTGRKRSRDEQIGGRSMTSLVATISTAAATTNTTTTTTTRVGLRHLTRELAIPTVPDMLKLRRRKKLQDTTVAARKIISAMNTGRSLPMGSRTSETTAASDGYHLGAEIQQSSKYHGKFNSKLWKNPKEEGPVPRVNLPNISLAITSLPSFEPLPKYTIPPTTRLDNDNNCKQQGYKFASPIKMSEAAWNLKSINNFSFSKPINARIYDRMEPPPSLQHHLDSPTQTQINQSPSTSETHTNAGAINFLWTASSTAPRLKVKTKNSREKSDNIGGGSSSPAVKKMANLKNDDVTNTVSELLSPRIATSQARYFEIWECNECYTKNDSRENGSWCVACKKSRELLEEASGPIGAKHADDGISNFGSRFKKNPDEWECESCLVRNKQTSLKCVSCSTAKPEKAIATGAALESSDGNPISMAGAFSAKSCSDLMDKFKPAEGSWECPGCMLRNPASVITCPCCNASKPSLRNVTPKKSPTCENKDASPKRELGIMDKFKPVATSWECSSCLVRNNDGANCCVCCSNPKPGMPVRSAERNTEPAVKPVSGWAEKFKKPEGSWSCDSCMIQNMAEVSKCIACEALKPGTIAKPEDTVVPKLSFGIPLQSSASNFNFGIDKAGDKLKSDATTSLVSTNGFIFGTKSCQNETPQQFTFGIPKKPTSTDETSLKVPMTNPTGFVFVSPNDPKQQVANDSAKDGFAKESSQVGTFAAFGQSKSANEKSDLREEKLTTNFGEEKVSEKVGQSASCRGNAPFVFGGQKSEVGREVGASKATGESATKPCVFGNQELSQTTDNSTPNSIKEEFVKSGTRRGTGEGVDAGTTIPPGPAPQAQSPFAFCEPKSKPTSQPTPPVPSSFGATSASRTPTGFPIPTIDDKPTAATFGVGASSFASFLPGSLNPSSQVRVEETSSSSIDAEQRKDCPAFGSSEKKSTFFGITGEKKEASFGTTVKYENHVPYGNPSNKSTAAVFSSSDKQVVTTVNSMFNAAPSLSTPSSSFGGPSAGISQQSIFGSATTPVFGGTNAGTGSFGGTLNIFAAGGGKSSCTSTPAPPPVTSNPSNLFAFGGASAQQQSAVAAAAAAAAATTVAPITQSSPGTFTFARTVSGAESSTSMAKPLFAFGSRNLVAGSQSSECFGVAGASATPGINAPFGTSVPANLASSPFTFNAPTSKQDLSPAPPPPTFGQATGGAGATSVAAIPNIFGTQQQQQQPQSQPQSQSQQSVPSNIGQQTQACPTGSFNFGASGSSTISGGFNFGSGMTQHPTTGTSGGFNFNTGATAPSIAFDPNTRPSFNFTGGSAPTVFNATPQPAPPRKIKKAVRRMQR